MTRLRKIPAVLPGFIFGFAMESAPGAISAVSVLAGSLVKASSPGYFPLAIFSTTVLLSVLAFLVLRFTAAGKEIRLSA